MYPGLPGGVKLVNLDIIRMQQDSPKPEIEQKRNGINLNSENIFFILQPIPG